MKKVAIALALVFSSSTFGEEPTLKSLMAIMGGQAHNILTGILYDDFQIIQDAVHWVNNHPSPTADLEKIKKELGIQVLRFKYYDTKAHNAANAIGVAAASRDMKEVTRQYGIMMNSCAKCHVAFRDRLRKVLHPNTF